MSKSKKKNYTHPIGVALVALGAIGFASKAILVKILYRHSLDTITILTLRMAFALPFFLLVILYHWNKPSFQQIRSKDRRFWIPLMGFFGYYLSSLLDFLGLQFVSAGLERLILFIYPTIVILLSAFFFRKPIQRIQIYALILTYLGISVALVTDFSAKSEYFWLGAFFIFCSAFTYSFYLLGSERLIPRIGSILYSSWVMLYATIFIFLHFIFFNQNNPFNYEIEVYGLSLLMALIATVIPVFLTAEGIRRIGAGDMAIVGNVGPVSTIILGYVFLDEPILPLQMLGTFLVMVGVFLIGSKKKTNQIQPEKSIV